MRALLRREGPLEPRRAARIVAQVGAALDAAHERGLVHRDVKPANVLLTHDEHAYLTDFGLIKRVGEGVTQISRPGGWVGTLGYVAPEQIRGERVDARADVYALGAVLYHSLSGRAPFAADTDEATLWSTLHDDPPTIGGDAPGAFDAVIRRALAKDAAHRYPSAGDLGRAALAAAGEPVPDEPERQVARGPAAPAPDVDTETVVSPGPLTAPTAQAAAGPAAPVIRTRRRWPLVAAGAVLVALAVGVIVALAAGGGGGGRKATGPPTNSTPILAETAAGTVRRTLPAGTRPNAIAIAGGQVWVTGFLERSVLRFDVRTGRRRGEVPVPAGTTEMAIGRGFVWLVNQQRRTVERISVRRARVVGSPFPVAGSPVTIAVTKTAVWVGSRSGARSGQRTQLLLKLNPRTGAVVNTIAIPRGVQDRAVAQIDVGLRPRGIAANAHAVWVAGYLASKLARVDPRRARPVGAAVGTDINPFKLALSGRTLWLTATGGDTVQQVTFR